MLITPHGDRKLAVRRRVLQPGLALITPHGDRKQTGLLRTVGAFPSLITPHGDRKRAFMPEGGGMIGYISLPLMRIENSSMAR